jgi:hypothetical protein
MPGRSLLALAPQVEERVVDPDGEADEQDHGREVLVHRRELARQRHQRHRRQHRRDADRERHQGRHKRAEGDHQDQQGEGQGERLRLQQVLGERLVQLLVGADVAELLDGDLRVVGRDRLDGCLRGLDPVPRLQRVPCDLELDQRRALVLGDRRALAQRRDHVDHVLRVLQPRDRVLDRGTELRIVDRQRLVLDQDGLVVRPQAGVLERVLGAPRLTGELVGAVDLVLADGVADQKRENDEAEPAPDRHLAVVGAPVSCTGGEIPALGHQDPSCSGRDRP